MNKETFNLQEIRDRLTATRGQRYWRSLEEVAQTPAFQDSCTGISRVCVRMERRSQPKTIPEDHGRFPGAGRAQRLLAETGGKNRSLRPAAGGNHSR